MLRIKFLYLHACGGREWDGGCLQNYKVVQCHTPSRPPRFFRRATDYFQSRYCLLYLCHRIRTKFSIIDPVKEANQKARLMKTHMKKNITSSHTGMKQHRNLEDAPIINTSSLLKRFYAQGATTDKLNGLRTSLPPPMVGFPTRV